MHGAAVSAGMAQRQHDWQSTIKLLEELAVVPVGSRSSTTAVRQAALQKYVDKLDGVINQLSQRTEAFALRQKACLNPLTQATWDKLVTGQVCSWQASFMLSWGLAFIALGMRKCRVKHSQSL
jgi:hypothetical protein